MNGPELKLEFYSEVMNVGDEVRQEARNQMEKLAEGHKDIIEASVAIEDLAGEETPYVYKVRIVVYMRPENIVVEEKGGTIMKTIKEALATVRRQVRKKREKLKETSHSPELKEPDIIYELSPVELYDTYTPAQDPQSIIDQGRNDLAAELMAEEKMEQKAAYYIAGQILEYAERAV